ncbi:hypothetical protein F2P81_015445 [Scophthalmus maximus]|uniref:Ras-GEF domain-containing protein n=1 Tax=Scophthalmus maximus TaxID=52904 RepID=A0A6A4SKU2_SCOMX|nr:hypothetical protein F2P81_015445 [Scophthalmus maximus]
MPAGMKPLEKFLKKQTTALTRAGGFVGGVADKASGGTGASRRRASLSRVVPFFRETSPESGQAREVFSPDSEDPPSWPSAVGTAPVTVPSSANGSGSGSGSGSGGGDVRSPSLSSDEQSSEASLITETGGGGGGGTPLPPDTPDNLTLAVLDSVAGKRYGHCTVFCRVYTPDHSYVTIRSRLSCRVGEILALVREKLQYSEDQPVQPGNLMLVAVTSAGEKAVFRPSDEAVFTTLGVNTHLFACEPSELDSLLPLPEEIHWTPGDSKLHDMSAEEVANQLVAFDWELFSCVHEVEFVCYVFHGEQARWRPLNLELVLQRCSEVQHWVATEILQCQSLPKRIQLLRKFIKIAALCKQQQDLLSFLAVVLGLDNPALGRLRLTWETKAYVRQLQVIDNQNLLFDMSCKLEPKDT